jgi:hypothetical protein
MAHIAILDQRLFSTVIPTTGPENHPVVLGRPVQVAVLDGSIERVDCFFAKVPNIEVRHQLVVRLQMTTGAVPVEGLMMRKLLHLDLHDLATMIGLASIAGSVTNMAFNAVSGANAPQGVAIAVAAAGFIGGRVVSEKLRNHKHG